MELHNWIGLYMFIGCLVSIWDHRYMNDGPVGFDNIGYYLSPLTIWPACLIYILLKYKRKVDYWEHYYINSSVE